MNYYLIKFEVKSFNREYQHETRLICMDTYDESQIRIALKEEFGEYATIRTIWNLTIEIESDDCDASEIDIH